MALDTGIGLIDSLSGLTISDVLAYTAQRNQAKIDLGAAKSNQYINELNAQTALLSQQMSALRNAQLQNQGGLLTDANGNLNQNVLLIGGLLAVGALVYFLGK